MKTGHNKSVGLAGMILGLVMTLPTGLAHATSPREDVCRVPFDKSYEQQRVRVAEWAGLIRGRLFPEVVLTVVTPPDETDGALPPSRNQRLAGVIREDLYRLGVPTQVRIAIVALPLADAGRSGRKADDSPEVRLSDASCVLLYGPRATLFQPVDAEQAPNDHPD